MKQFLSWVLTVIILSMQTGCVKQNELGNIAIVTGLFLEKNQQDYILVADIADFSGEQNKEAILTQPIRVTAPSLEEAFSNLEKHSDMPLYLFRAKVLLLGKEIQKDLEVPLLEELFRLRKIPADIWVLQADFTENEFLSREDKSFGLPLSKRLKKEESLPDCKLYQIIKNQKEHRNIPTVLLSENGFFLTTDTKKIFSEPTKQKEGAIYETN